MRKTILFLLLLSASWLQGQTVIPITDNLVINSNQNLKFEEGDYAFSDPEGNGVIQLNNVENVILDGENVTIDGGNDEGYFIYLEDCSNILIKNFELATNYFYAIHAVNSDQVRIENCTFSGNKRDDEGWIVIFEGPEGAHGGGVFVNECENFIIQNNTMTDQNDGIALYNSDSIMVFSNDFSWNTSYGIRMYHTHHCDIQGNDCSHVNRPETDPSDCAAILLLDAFDNYVGANNFTYSGDGIFVNNYETMEPANNVFEENDCSYSPHNAIEAVFSSSNIFRNNVCNNSNYGLWLGYSFDNIVEGNEIGGNSGLDPDGGAGIAIDRGYNNLISQNILSNNNVGIKLWEGNLIPPYTNESQDYQIENNYFWGNRRAMHIANTENLLCDSNLFQYDLQGIFLEGDMDGILIENNTFWLNSGFYIENHSPSDILAANNTFPEMPIPGFLDGKIYDKADAPGSGKVIIEPYIPGDPMEVVQDVSGELCDWPYQWNKYFWVEDAASISIYWDEDEKVTDDRSLYLATESGWDVHFHCLPGPYHHAIWKLDEEGSIRFWMKINITDPNNLWGVQESFVRIGDAYGNYFQYNNDYFQDTDPYILNNALGQWAEFDIPISGNNTWLRSQFGEPDLDSINYITFNVDVWEYGYELWLDSLTLPVVPVSLSPEPEEKDVQLTVYPNPCLGFLDCGGGFFRPAPV
jgi:parallel beta-helix repeat protein